MKTFYYHQRSSRLACPVLPGLLKTLHCSSQYLFLVHWGLRRTEAFG